MVTGLNPAQFNVSDPFPLFVIQVQSFSVLCIAYFEACLVYDKKKKKYIEVWSKRLTNTSHNL